MSFWAIIYEFISRIVQLFDVFGKKEKMTSQPSVIVKFSSRPYVELQIDQKWSIGELKEKLGKKLDLPVEDIKLIFAGKELQNESFIEEFDLGNQSVIHAVPSLKSSVDVETNKNGDKRKDSTFGARRIKLSDTGTTDVEAPKKKAGFFVYCNSCKDLERGKLRVRCNECKQGTLTVNQDPCCWDDVLTPGKIPGICQSDNCKGSIAEFYFKCANHPSAEDETCVALYQIRYNDLEAGCLSCMDINDIILVFTCQDSHVLCVDCFTRYCTSRLSERQFIQDLELGYTLPCPAGCRNSLIKETHHFRLLGDELYARYQRFGAEECLLQAGGVLCPVPGCGAGILPDPDCNRITCVTQGGQGCGFVFCRNCLQGFHLGECDNSDVSAAANTPVIFTINSSQMETARNRLENPSNIRLITKPCPRCRTPTERDGGCMHMICTRPNCGFHWCWVCQCEWNRECMGNHWFG